MNGKDLINNMIDELDRAKTLLLNATDGDIDYELIYELVDDICNDISRCYDVSDSINALLEDVEV